MLLHKYFGSNCVITSFASNASPLRTKRLRLSRTIKTDAAAANLKFQLLRPFSSVLHVINAVFFLETGLWIIFYTHIGLAFSLHSVLNI